MAMVASGEDRTSVDYSDDGRDVLGRLPEVNPELSVMFLEASFDVLFIEPLAMDFSMVEKVSINTPRSVSLEMINNNLQNGSWAN